MPRYLITRNINYLMEVEPANAEAARAVADFTEPDAWDVSDATRLDVFQLTDSVLCSICHKLVPAETAHEY